jgi:hypothetical protein
MSGKEGVGNGALESSADAEDAVVGFLGRKTLNGSLNNVGLLGNQVIESQSEFPVAGSVGVPLGKWHHPALEPWALDNVVGERRSGHGD